MISLGTILFENWNRYMDPFTGRYLQPEPLLQEPDFIARSARLGEAVPSYAYSGNNPVRFIDADGLYKMSAFEQSSGGSCPNFAKASELAKQELNCDDGQPQECNNCQDYVRYCTLQQCNLCDFLEPGRGPEAIGDVFTVGKAAASQTRIQTLPGLALLSMKMHFLVDDCMNPAAVGELARAMVHEAIHGCEAKAFRTVSHSGRYTPANAVCDVDELECMCIK